MADDRRLRMIPGALYSYVGTDHWQMAENRLRDFLHIYMQRWNDPKVTE